MAEEKKAVEGDKVVKLSDTVKFIASYPKDYKGKQHMKQDATYKLHRLHAERLVKKGLGKISSSKD